MVNSVLELSGWKLVEGVTRLLKGSFLTKEQAMKVCAVALECVHPDDDELEEARTQGTTRFPNNHVRS